MSEQVDKLKQAIDNVITSNQRGGITAKSLNLVLNQMADVLSTVGGESTSVLSGESGPLITVGLLPFMFTSVIGGMNPLDVEKPLCISPIYDVNKFIPIIGRILSNEEILNNLNGDSESTEPIDITTYITDEEVYECFGKPLEKLFGLDIGVINDENTYEDENGNQYSLPLIISQPMIIKEFLFDMLCL
jgi:hypothetical protein